MAVLQTPARGGLEHDPFPPQRRAGLTHGEIDEQRAVARGSRGQREALLEPRRRVHVPFRQLRAAQRDPRPLTRQLSGVHRGEPLAPADAREAQREQLRAARRGAVHDANARAFEIGPEVLGPVRGLEALGVGARLVLPLRQMPLHAGQPVRPRSRRGRRGSLGSRRLCASGRELWSLGNGHRSEEDENEKREQPSEGGRGSHGTFSSWENARRLGDSPRRPAFADRALGRDLPHCKRYARRWPAWDTGCERLTSPGQPRGEPCKAPRGLRIPDGGGTRQPFLVGMLWRQHELVEGIHTRHFAALARQGRGSRRRGEPGREGASRPRAPLPSGHRVRGRRRRRSGTRGGSS
jgi:hypothetical protein